MFLRKCLTLTGFLVLPPCFLSAEPLKVHFISGSKEYGSDPSLREFETYLENAYRIQEECFGPI